MSEFEQAVEAVIAGDEATLRAFLDANPNLIRIRSERRHRATLLHYIAANGVEDQRQITPPNAVAIARMLLDAGAEVDAENDAYGGHCTTMVLLVSSVHPARAGVQAALVDTLVDYGAAVDGVANDGSPLTTALAFHYIDAAEALVRRGARVDTLPTAAAMGREDLVREYLASGAAPRAVVRWGAMPSERELALHWAAAFGRASIVDLLAKAGADLTAKDGQGFTALHWAAFRGQLEAMDVLLAHGAPLDAVNNYGGTILGSTRWAAANNALGIDYGPAIAKIIAAGGTE